MEYQELAFYKIDEFGDGEGLQAMGQGVFMQKVEQFGAPYTTQVFHLTDEGVKALKEAADGVVIRPVDLADMAHETGAPRTRYELYFSTAGCTFRMTFERPDHPGVGGLVALFETLLKRTTEPVPNDMFSLVGAEEGTSDVFFDDLD